MAALSARCLTGHVAAMVEFQSAWDDPMCETPSESQKGCGGEEAGLQIISKGVVETDLRGNS